MLREIYNGVAYFVWSFLGKPMTGAVDFDRIFELRYELRHGFDDIWHSGHLHAGVALARENSAGISTLLPARAVCSSQFQSRLR